MTRCRDNYRNKKYYFEKGISVCEDWHDYLNFKEWALNNGYNEKLEIDRKDNNKGYNPENCRFITRIENNSNRSNTIMVNYNGTEVSLTLLCIELGFTANRYNSIRRRIKTGWDHTKAIEMPIMTDKHRPYDKNNSQRNGLV